ncbi:MAG: DUF2520 domain-containing protein [Bacteroidales bacterium]|nr:DUF2520 domain-containing protein [Bacteroidales bacterium]MBN2632820.1 DUF2520 domain-containing protein [Bacteroidales bacterium]
MTMYAISFAGAGNVAATLCREFYRSGIQIDRIVSKTEKKGRSLAADCNAEWSDELSFGAATRVIIVAVPDHSLREVLASIECPGECIVAHTAGSFGLEVFPPSISKKAVFYPFQTFTSGRKLNVAAIPFLLEASDDDTAKLLQDLASTLGAKTAFMDTDTRKMLHLAAVFVCNFTNYLLTAGKEITSEAGLDYKILEPLVNETIAKAFDTGPDMSQTGPAIRNDLNTIEKHLKLLSFSPELQKIYYELTESIRKHYKTDQG